MQFELPFEITTVVDGKKMQAMILEVISDTYNRSFKIRFEDGFEDNFLLAGGDDLGPIGSKPNWTPYATALAADLLIIGRLREERAVRLFRHKIGGRETNVWVIDEHPQQDMGYFYVYYNKRCRFRFDKNPATNNWRIVKSYSGDVDVNLDLIGIAGAMIELEQSKISITA